MDTEFIFQFRVKDPINGDEPTITIYADTYKNALRKIRLAQLPRMSTLQDIEDNLIFLSLTELDKSGNPPPEGDAVKTVDLED